MDIQPLLVVEDETLIRMDLVDLLEGAGYTVDEGADGADGIGIIDAGDEFSGLITDVNLGAEVDGWDVARHARRKFPNLAVVYVTGDSAADWPVEGVADSLVVNKPFSDAQILEAIKTLLT